MALGYRPGRCTRGANRQPHDFRIVSDYVNVTKYYTVIGFGCQMVRYRDHEITLLQQMDVTLKLQEGHVHTLLVCVT